MEEKDIRVGTKNGCLTVVGDLDTYNKEKALERIKHLEEEKQEFLDGVWHQNHSGNIDSVNHFDDCIEDEKKRAEQLLYKCQCKCGKIYYLTSELFLSKRHRYCDIIDPVRAYQNTISPLYFTRSTLNKFKRENGCGLRRKEYNNKLKNTKPIPDEHYDKKLNLKVHATLEILGEGPDIEKIHENKNRLCIWLSKSYRCKCQLCEKELLFKFEDFEISNDDFGARAIDGYYSNAVCDCHKTSSFEWRTIKIFVDNNIEYRTEVSFDDLVGVGGKNLLRYDFAVYDNEKIKALIECQGKQHYEPSEEFGYENFLLQQKNDELKRQYAKTHGIKLIEIHYKYNTYDKEAKFLLDELSF